MEKFWEPGAGQREGGAHALKTCCPVVPDKEKTEKSHVATWSHADSR